jgi:hypothetical protein
MDKEMEDILARFKALDSAVIDASSMIYMHKAGFLEILSRTIRLCSLPEIMAETGYEGLAVTHVGRPPDDLNNDRTDDLTNDQRLVRCALEQGLPLISEDRQLLMQMKREEHPYYNALMMLHFLLFRARVSKAEHARYLEHLLKTAWYGSRVLEKGAFLLEIILAQRAGPY